jgi:hypothetical protein
MIRLRRHLSYSNVVSTLALFLVLSTGVVYAADTIGSSDVIDESLLSQDIKDGEVKGTELAANSVGTAKIANGTVQGLDILDSTIASADIQNSQVRTADVADENLTGADVLNDSLTGGDINESTLGQVPSAGSVANLTIVERVGNAVTFGNQNANNGSWLSASSLAQCLPGETAIGGGGNWADGEQDANEALALTDSRLEGTNSWRATAISDADNDTFRAHVYCFQGG